jgi:hypothetical protein
MLGEVVAAQQSLLLTRDGKEQHRAAGRRGSVAKVLATSSSPALPEALSTAPL